jgi:hypothetical protein
VTVKRPCAVSNVSKHDTCVEGKDFIAVDPVRRAHASAPIRPVPVAILPAPILPPFFFFMLDEQKEA